MYVQWAAGVGLQASAHVSWRAGRPSGPQWSIAFAAVLHESPLGVHWLHRFASVLQPAAPQSSVVVPSPLSLHVRAMSPSQPRNSLATQDEIGSGSSSAGLGKPHAAARHSRPRIPLMPGASGPRTAVTRSAGLVVGGVGSVSRIAAAIVGDQASRAAPVELTGLAPNRQRPSWCDATSEPLLDCARICRSPTDPGTGAGAEDCRFLWLSRPSSTRGGGGERGH